MMLHRLRLLLVALVLASTQHTVRADEYSDLKQSVRLRAPTIQELKQRGIMREGPDGLLVASADCPAPQKLLLDEENADRTRLFQIIGERTGQSAGQIASRFSQLATARSPLPSATPISASATPPPVTNTPPQPPPAQSQPLPNARTAALRMKVLTRPLASVHADADSQSRKVRENTPAFTAFYVYQKRDGWYEIGEDSRGRRIGWIKAGDAIEWKQNLVVEFTHPEGRQPVLMFDQLPALQQVINLPRGQRQSAVNQFYTTINSGRIPPGFPVQTMEPRRAVSSRNQFYLLPIVDFRTIDNFDGREGRLLQLASATRQRGTSTLTDPAERDQLNRSTDLNAAAARGVKVDLVFVMDLSRSMGPFAERTLEMIDHCVQQLGIEREVIEAVRFGFWGYRDFPELCKGIDYNTFNYTPELLPLDQFAQTLKTVQETKIDSIDYEEDVFAGVADAVEKTRWREKAIRLIILVGDAPGRAPGVRGVGYPNGPRGTMSGMDAENIRNLADSRDVYISSLYLKVPKWQRYAETGSTQFRALARNPNDQPGAESFVALNAADTSVYGPTAEAIAQGIVERVRYSLGKGGTAPEQPGAAQSPANNAETPEQGAAAGRRIAGNMFRGAMVEWLGARDAAKVPRDVTTWAADKDLGDPAIQALDVQVFLTKNELNNLKLVMDSVLNAGTRGKISGEDFFAALRAVVASAAVDPTQIQNAENLAKTGLVPEFLKDLPYQSTLMGMNNESWSRMSPDAQDQFLNTVLAKLRYYQLVHDNSERWIALNEGDDRDSNVAAIPLEQLP